MDALLGAGALEAAGEARAASRTPPAGRGCAAGRSAPRGGSSPACRSARAAARRRAAPSASRRTACVRLRARVLDVVRLVEHQRARASQRQAGAVRVDDLVVEDRDVGGRARRCRCPETMPTERCGQPVLGLAQPVELQARGADDDRRVAPSASSAASACDRLAEPLLVGQERPPRVQHVARRRRAGTGAARRRARPRPRAAGRRGRASGARRRSPRRARRAGARACAGRVGRDVDRERAQVVLERLEQVRVDRAPSGRAPPPPAAPGTRGRVRVPVDVELEPRLADARRSARASLARAPGRPAGARRSGARAGPGARRAAPSSASATGCAERQPLRPAALDRAAGEWLRQLAGDRRRDEPPVPSCRAAVTRPTQPAAACASHALDLRRGAQRGWRSSTPCTYGAVASACGAHHSLRLPVEAPPGDRAHRVDDSRR